MKNALKTHHVIRVQRITITARQSGHGIQRT